MADFGRIVVIRPPMDEKDVRPFIDEHGVGCCDEDCPSHDGKRCRILGRRPEHVCEPWARLMVLEVRQLREGKERAAS